MIEIRNLNKSYNRHRSNEIRAVRDTSLDLPDTGMVAIFGRSGCGKTTLLNVIGGLDTYDSGTLKLNGSDVSPKADAIRNRDIGYIFQNYNLNEEETVFENVADSLLLCGMTDTAEIERRVEQALSAVGMEKYRRRLPGTLSGGQQQRVAIARAIVKGARVILADEPTGNLDDENTLLVMNLLRMIARDHLVLLVTHEADLVDYYCEQVIEVVDGAVASIRQNERTDGVHRTNQHDIYLGDLQKQEMDGAGLQMTVYAEADTIGPLHLRLVQVGNTIFLDTGGDKRIKLLTGDSEVTLKEGTYAEEARRLQQMSQERAEEFADFTPPDGAHYGRLYRWKNSLTGSWRSIFKRKKHGRKFVFALLALFAVIIVFMASAFGVALKEFIDIGRSFNHQVVLVRIGGDSDAEKAERVIAGAGDGVIGYGYREGRIAYGYQSFASSVSFSIPDMETYKSNSNRYYYYGSGSSLTARGIFTSAELCRDLRVLAGTRDLTAEGDVVITSNMASRMIEESPYDFIRTYEDLLYLAQKDTGGNGQLRIVGVVESSENNLYVSPAMITADLLNRSYLSAGLVSMDSDLEGTEPPQTGSVYLSEAAALRGGYEVGSVVTVRGRRFTVAAIVKPADKGDHAPTLSKEVWLAEMRNMYPLDDFCDPELRMENEFCTTYAADLYATWYMDQMGEYVAYIWSNYKAGYDFSVDDYILSQGYGMSDECRKYILSGQDRDLFLAMCYYTAVGDFELTDMAEFETFREENDSLWTAVQTEYAKLADEARSQMPTYADELAYSVYLNERDYAALATSYGRTEPALTTLWWGGDDDGHADTESALLLHVKDAKAFVKEMRAAGLQASGPAEFFEEAFEETGAGILSSLIVFAVVLLILSLCVFFVMRSSMMVRIREVGVNRAIGVSRRNIIFRFFVESLVLTALTVFVGYLLASVLCGYLTSFSILRTRMYYPGWLAAIVGAVLFGISLFCGTLPVRNLLRKTPSEILTKYDI